MALYSQQKMYRRQKIADIGEPRAFDTQRKIQPYCFGEVWNGSIPTKKKHYWVRKY